MKPFVLGEGFEWRLLGISNWWSRKFLGPNVPAPCRWCWHCNEQCRPPKKRQIWCRCAITVVCSSLKVCSPMVICMLDWVEVEIQWMFMFLQIRMNFTAWETHLMKTKSTQRTQCSQKYLTTKTISRGGCKWLAPLKKNNTNQSYRTWHTVHTRFETRSVFCMINM